MTASYIQELFSERIGGTTFGKEEKLYKFEKIKRAKAEARKRYPGVRLLDFGVGEPDEMAPSVVVEALKEECSDKDNRGYADNGIDELKFAAADYMDCVFGVAGLDPPNQIVHSIGSKPALAMIPSAFINPGDITLMTAPGYPVMATHTIWCGGEVVTLPLRKENAFLPDLDSVSTSVLKRTKLLYLNYPNNPTGAGATSDFFRKVVRFAERNRIVVIHDAAYSALSYDRKPLSFLSVDGAMDVGMELHSFSKAFNMTGWRLAFAVGNSSVVKAFANVKDNNDSGQFKAIQKAAICALNQPQITENILSKYERRLHLMVNALNETGFNARVPDGTFYLYVEAPRGIKGKRVFESAEDASQYLIKEKLISTVPWDDAGRFIRFSATFEAESEDEELNVIGEMKGRLSEVSLSF